MKKQVSDDLKRPTNLCNKLETEPVELPTVCSYEELCKVISTVWPIK